MSDHVRIQVGPLLHLRTVMHSCSSLLLDECRKVLILCSSSIGQAVEYGLSCGSEGDSEDTRLNMAAMCLIMMTPGLLRELRNEE